MCFLKHSTVINNIGILHIIVTILQATPAPTFSQIFLFLGLFLPDTGRHKTFIVRSFEQCGMRVFYQDIFVEK